MIFSALAAILWGVASARLFGFLTWLNLIPWALTGAFCGALVKDKKQAMRNGAIYGFLLPVSFQFAGYGGTLAIKQLLSFFIFSLVLGIIGIGCGTVLSLIGFWIRSLSAKIHAPTASAKP